MSLFKIAWRSIQQRGVASALTMFSMALGVAMVVAVLSIHGVVARSFRNNASLGYNLIVGAKGGRLDLTLNTVYYLSKPVENIPFAFLTEFMSREARDEAFRDSIQFQTLQLQHDTWQAAASAGLASSWGLEGVALLAAEQGLYGARTVTLDLGRDGKYAQFTGLAVPVCLGDYFGHFRVVGTTPAMFDELKFGPAADQSYEFAQGRNFQTWNPENGYYEAVVGSSVARELNVQLGDGISPSHGDPEGESHSQKFTVVGILAPSATPNDRAVFVNMEGFYLMDDHAKPLEEAGDSLAATPAAASTPAAAQQARLPVEQREVTSILVRTSNPFVAMSLPNLINEGPNAQCVLPVREITGLFEFIVKPIQVLLLVLTALICVVSGISILVSIYNSMSDRRHEIAVMRALGASRETVMSVILLESVLLSLGGGALGWMGGHTLNAVASPYIEERTGVSIGFFDLAPPVESLELAGLGTIIGKMSLELAIIPSLLLLAMVVGLLPAVAAYRTDVAKSLGS
ncbi:MAG: ABC transporter permease [Pirellulaceae bacterium]